MKNLISVPFSTIKSAGESLYFKLSLALTGLSLASSVTNNTTQTADAIRTQGDSLKWVHI